MSTKTETLALALQHHRAGRIQQAEQLYRSILQAGSTDPQVWCYLGTAQLALGQPAQAEASYHQAIAIAQQQSAKLWELRAATSLAQLWLDRGKRAEARDLLAPVCGWFTEGFGMPVLQDAMTLLEELV